jgi:predicted transcriptional regulator
VNSDVERTKKFRALKAAIEEGMADLEAGRVVPWEDVLEQIRERVIAKSK